MTPTDRSLTLAPLCVPSFLYCLMGLACALYIGARWRASVWHA
jgi:hypothetical protein